MRLKFRVLRTLLFVIPTSILLLYPSTLDAKFLKVIQDVPMFRRGDVNGDLIIDIGDPVALMEFIFLGAFSPGCMDACDVNDDGSVDNTDVIFLLSVIFEGDGPIPSPGPDSCGNDPTPDELDCAQSNCEGLGHAGIHESTPTKKE